MKYINKERVSVFPSAIIFDTDNTLYPYEPANKEAMAAVRQKFVSTFNLPMRDFDKTFEKARLKTKKNLVNTASSHSRLLYLQKTLEMLGLGSQVLWALDLEQTYWRTFLANSKLFDDLTDCLDTIRSLKIPTAIVTDLTAQIQFRKIIYFGLDHYFDFIVTSEEAGFDKPNPAPFRIALEKLEVDRSRVWMIGDNPVNDIRGAKEAFGGVTIQKIHEGVELGTEENAPDAHFWHFKELQNHLSNLAKTKEEICD